MYDDDGMLWSQDWIKPTVGYTVESGRKRNTYQQTLNAPGSPSAYKFHDVVGNTNFKGRWTWKLADNFDNNAEKCYEWYAIQPSEDDIDKIRKESVNDCPCILKQMESDRRFRMSSRDSIMICYERRETGSLPGTSISYHTSCCYDPDSRSLINTVDPELGLATQVHISLSYSSALIHSSNHDRSRSRIEAVADGTKALGYCCQKSSLCHLYHQKRPVPTCSLYEPPRMGKYISLAYRQKYTIIQTDKFSLSLFSSVLTDPLSRIHD